MSQSRISSLKESAVQTGIGFGLSLALQIVMSHVYNMSVTLFQNIQITMYFTILSLVRGYVVRRWFNKGERK